MRKILEGLSSKKSPKSESKFTDNTLVPYYGHFSDAPIFNLLNYNRQLERSNFNAYQYALNDIFSTGSVVRNPGSYQFRVPRRSVQYVGSLTKKLSETTDPNQACRTLKKLLTIDGVDTVRQIPKKELIRPKHHYFIVVLKRKDSNSSGTFIPMVIHIVF